MAGNCRVFIDINDYNALVTTGSNTNVIQLKVYPYMAVHAGTISGLQTISLQGVAKTEVAIADIDVLANIGKYAVSATNVINLIVDKTAVPDAVKAKEYITGLLMTYQMVDLEYSGTTAIYTMETSSADGTALGTTKPTDLTTLMSKMECLDDDLDVNLAPGYYTHTLIRALIAS